MATVRNHDIEPEDYFDIASVYACVVSPGGDQVTYVESRWGEGKEGRQNDLWVLDIANQQRLRLTFDGFGASGPVWDPAGQWIYFLGSNERSGEEKPPYDGSRQVWRVSATGGELFPVTREENGVSFFALTQDGRELFYITNVETYAEEWRDLRKKYADLEYGHGIADLNAVWRLDLESWRAAEVIGTDQVIRDIALSPSGDRLAIITVDDEELIFHEGWSRVELLDLATGERELLTEPEWRSDHPSPFGWLEHLAWSADGDALAFSISFDGYPSRIYVLEQGSAGWSLQQVSRPGLVNFDGNLTWRGKGRTLCYRGEEMGRLRIYATDKVKDGTQGQTRELASGDIVTGPFGFSRDGKVLVASCETTTRLNDLYLVKKPERLERLTDLNPQVAQWKLPQIEHISWTGADGDQVYGILELPPDYQPDDGPLPLIVELHGGPTSSTKYRLRLWIYGRALMPARGFALFSPNYHGSTGYGDAFLEKLIGRENEIEVTDILTGMDALFARGIADPERVGVMGWSNGGYLTNCLITTAPERFKAASSGAGVLDMVIQWGTEDTPGHVINYMEGLPWEKPDHYRAGSPLYNLHRVTTPTLIHVGGNDPRVPPAHSRALYRALRHYLDVPTELVVYPGEGHGLSTHENRLAKMEWDLAWFERYLQEEQQLSETDTATTLPRIDRAYDEVTSDDLSEVSGKDEK
jgi:dipeptidyl aminopeptidase/acylaminoacyl peptidase